MGKGKTFPKDGKGRTKKAQSIRPPKSTLLEAVEEHKKKTDPETRKSIREKFLALRPKREIPDEFKQNCVHERIREEDERHREKPDD